MCWSSSSLVNADRSRSDGIDQDFDQEIDQRPLSELPLRPARELVGLGAGAEGEDMLL
jgi:hypothetical protein